MAVPARGPVAHREQLDKGGPPQGGIMEGRGRQHRLGRLLLQRAGAEARVGKEVLAALHNMGQPLQKGELGGIAGPQGRQGRRRLGQRLGPLEALPRAELPKEPVPLGGQPGLPGRERLPLCGGRGQQVLLPAEEMDIGQPGELDGKVHRLKGHAAPTRKVAQNDQAVPPGGKAQLAQQRLEQGQPPPHPADGQHPLGPIELDMLYPAPHLASSSLPADM